MYFGLPSNLLPMRLVCFLLLFTRFLSAQSDRWDIIHGETLPGVVWRVHEEIGLPHADNIETAGRGVAGIIHYAVDADRRVSVRRELIYPQFRPFIKDTDPAWWGVYRNYLRREYSDEEALPAIYVNDRKMSLAAVDSIRIQEMLSIYHQPTIEGLRITRRFYPAPREHRFYEFLQLRNVGPDTLTVRFADRSIVEEHLGAAGSFTTRTDVLPLADSVALLPGQILPAFLAFSAGATADASDQATYSEAEGDFFNRQYFGNLMTGQLVLETPDSIYNTLFALSKLRGAESIFDSKLGLVHSPGGGRYYTGFWANDQAEYINPFFPYLGDRLANEAALNMWRIYQDAIPEEGNIRYSFEMAGDAPVNRLDRGDAAMIAYGLSHYLLALGDPAIARELWPLLTWCLEYNHQKLNDQGVVASDSDEMEGRIATGNANLSTSSLYYGALETSISLARALGEDDKLVKTWTDRRSQLGRDIEAFFGRRVEGLDTYRYFDGHEALRHWIALPLVVGLHGRKAGTLTALFDRLWTDNGVAVEKNHPDPNISNIFWDRGTLYALRGAFLAGATERAHERLRQFSRQRLLGERVPYVVEAYPEGNMAHLSAESGLYCRVFTEGLFGMLPTGFRSFRLQPRLPVGWDEMALRDIRAFGQPAGFDVIVRRKKDQLRVLVQDALGFAIYEQVIAPGTSLEVELN